MLSLTRSGWVIYMFGSQQANDANGKNSESVFTINLTSRMIGERRITAEVEGNLDLQYLGRFALFRTKLTLSGMYSRNRPTVGQQ